MVRLAVVEPARAALAHRVRIVHVSLVGGLVGDKIGLVSGHRGLGTAPDAPAAQFTSCLGVVALFAA